jgi:glucose/arabinose dehydrogenase
VVLNAAPTANVTIALTNTAGQTATTPTSLTFTPQNWDTPQTVTVTAVDDTAVEGPHTGTITHTVTSTDTRYSGLTVAPLTVNITDNDVPPPSGTGTGLRGEYFDNVGFTGLVLTRTDATVNFDWGTGSPDLNIGTDTFSVRWTGQVEAPSTGTYTFYTTTDDGVRLFVNNQLIIDKYVIQPSTEWSGAIALEAGKKYDIRLEYFDNTGRAVARLAWAGPGITKQIIPQSRLYNSNDDVPTFALKDNRTIYVGEGDRFATVTVVRRSSFQTSATVEYTTNEIGGSNSATPGLDYTRPTYDGKFNTGQIIFNPGEIEKSFTIPIINDSVSEENEVFAVGLQNPSVGTLEAPRTVLITILDNDSSSSFSMSNPSITITESDPSVTITVQRSGNTTLPGSVTLATLDGTATAGNDFTGTSGRIIDFAPGETSKTLSIPILNDPTPESTETFSVKLISATGGAINPTQEITTVSILDNDLEFGSLSRETVLTGLVEPVSFDWTPDGRYMFVAQKNGTVRVLDRNTLRSTPLIDIQNQVNNVRDRGLLGIAIHPEFFQGDPYVYLLYTYDDPSQTIGRPGLAGPDKSGNRPARLGRFTVDLNTMVADPLSEQVILGKNSIWAYTSRPDGNSTGDPSILPSGIHNGTTIIAPPELIEDPDPVNLGRDYQRTDTDFVNNNNIRDYLATDSESHTIGAVHFGPDGKLYVTVGDGTSYNFMDPRAVRVQDVDNLSGKMLRIDPITGQGLPDNPFYLSGSGTPDPDSNRSKVFYLGNRNSFRFTFDPVTTLPVLGEVGWNSWEEINTGPAGSNFGWPYYEGTLRTGGYSALPQAVDYYQREANGNQTTTLPILALSHGAPDNANAIVIGDFYNTNTLIFGNLGSFATPDTGKLYAATLNASRQITNIQVFDSGIPYVLDMEMGPDGNLYGVTGAGSIVRWVRTQPQGLVGYWRFEEPGTTILDSSGNGNTGTLVNSTIVASSSSLGQSLQVSGRNNSHATIPASTSLNSPTNQITVAAWLRPTGQPRGFQAAVNKQIGTIVHPDSFYLGFGPRQWSDGATTYKWELATNNTGELAIYEGIPTAGSWVHMAGTYDGTRLRLYVNGVEIIPTANSYPGGGFGTGNIRMDSNPVTLGGAENGSIDGDASADPYPGLIDEVQIYNRALSLTEINDIFTRTRPN